MSNYPVLMIAQCLGFDRLITVDSARLIGNHLYTVRQPDIVPPFIIKVDKNTLNASSTVSSFTVGASGVAGNKKKMMAAYLQYNASGKERLAGVPFASPGVLTQSQSSKHSSYLTDKQYELIGKVVNKEEFIKEEMAFLLKQQKIAEMQLRKSKSSRSSMARQDPAVTTTGNPVGIYESISGTFSRPKTIIKPILKQQSPMILSGSQISGVCAEDGDEIVVGGGAAPIIPVGQKELNVAAAEKDSRNRVLRPAAAVIGSLSTTPPTGTRGSLVDEAFLDSMMKSEREGEKRGGSRVSSAITKSGSGGRAAATAEPVTPPGSAKGNKAALLVAPDGRPSARRERVDENLSTNLFALLPDSKLLVSCGHWDNSFKITHVDSGKMVQSISHHREVVTCVAVAADFGKYWIVSGSKDCIVCVWMVHPDREIEPVTVSPESVLYGHDDSVNCVAINAELDIVVSGSDDGTIIVHTLRDACYLRSIVFGSTISSSPAYRSSSSKRDSISLSQPSSLPHATVGQQPSLNAASPPPMETSETRRQKIVVVKRRIHLLTLSREGFIVAFSADGNILAVYTINGRYIKVLDVKDCIYAMCMSEDGKIVVTGGERGLLVFRWASNLMIANNGPRKDLESVVDGSNGQTHDPISSPIRSIYLAPEERQLIVGLESGHIRVLAQVR